MLKISKPGFLRSRAILLVWGLCILWVFLVMAFSILLSVPTISPADGTKIGLPPLDPAILIAAAVIPVAFLIVLLSRRTRAR